MNTLNNKDKSGIKIILSILAIYAVCFLLRSLEYFLIRTDQTFWGEAFIHKLLGIAICFIVIRKPPDSPVVPSRLTDEQKNPPMV